MTSIDVSRHVNTKKLSLKVKVLTPMFLGGAKGHAELRPAPFKAALRYWWRLTQPQQNYEKLLKTEQELFGGTFQNKEKKIEPLKSYVSVHVAGQISIDNGKTNFETDKKILHPEVKNFKGHPKKINSLVYLGMGPIFWNKNARQMEYNKSRIRSGTEFKLNIGFPKNNSDIIKAVSLLHHFGCIGGRNRNSWGSIEFDDKKNTIMPLDKLLKDSLIKISFNDCFKLNYASGIPYCKKAYLVWYTPDRTNPYDVMHDLAKMYVELRTDFKFSNGMTQKPQERHILGYPVTNHKVKDWEPEKSGRMPSQLRFKVVENKTKKFSGRILHLAHRLPKKNPWDLNKEKKIWGKVHEFLDKNMTRVTI